MARKPRSHFPGALYHVISRGNRRQGVFLDEKDKEKDWGQASVIQENKVLKVETLALCKKMAKLRNDYAHGDGPKPKEDALKALSWMHSFIDNETNLMRNYIIVDGILHRSVTRK